MSKTPTSKTPTSKTETKLTGLQRLLLENTTKRYELAKNVRNDKLLPKLKSELGLSSSSASYIVAFANAIHLLATEFPNFDQFINKIIPTYKQHYDPETYATKDKAGQLRMLITDPYVQLKYPKAFVDLVLNVFHSNELLKAYDIKTTKGNTITLLPKSNPVLDLRDTIDVENPAGYFEELMAKRAPKLIPMIYKHDKNWISFKPKNHAEGAQLRSFYGKLYSKDFPEIKMWDNPNMFVPSWCIVSSSSSFFNSQKGSPSDDWYITFSKKSLPELIKLVLDTEDIYDPDGKTLRDNLLFPDSKPSRVNNYLGEVFLRTSRLTSGNRGFHLFTNDVTQRRDNSSLAPLPTYNYPDALGSSNPFLIENGVLKSTNVNTDTIHVPLGVTEIAENAFRSAPNAKRIALPPSVRTLKTDAFIGVPDLTHIFLNDTLETIESGAFNFTNDRGLPRPVTEVHIGVPVPGELNTYKRPKNLKYISRIYDVIVFKGQTADTLVPDDKYKRRQLLYVDQPGLVIEAGVLKRLDAFSMPDDLAQELVIPEGTTYVTPSAYIGELPTKLVLPKSMQAFPHRLLNTDNRRSSNLRVLDMSRAVITVIPDSAFAMNNSIREIMLPTITKIIGESAFTNSINLERLFIPSSVESISEKAFRNNINLKEITTDNPAKLTEIFKANKQLVRLVNLIKSNEVN